jgi:hypothetical protein
MVHIYIDAMSQGLQQMIGSQKLIYTKSITNLGYLGGSFKMQSSMPLGDSRLKFGFRVLQVHLSNEYPNMYVSQLYNEITNELRITRDGGLNWIQCIYSPGYYSVLDINLGIGKAQLNAGWCTAITKAPITIAADPTSGSCIIIFEPANDAIVAGDYAVDLGSWDVRVKTATLLGFAPGAVVANTLPGVAEEFYSTTEPRIDFQSGAISVSFSFFGSAYKDGVISNETVRLLATQPNSVNAAGTPINIQSRISWPKPGDPIIVFPATIPEQFNEVRIDFLDARSGRKIEHLYGDAYVMWDFVILGTNR